MRPWPRLVLALACALAGLVAAPSALASVGSQPPVPSLDPRGTQAEWERLVAAHGLRIESQRQLPLLIWVLTLVAV